MGENGICATTDAKGAQELLTEFQETGRQAAFEEIARRYAGMVYNVAYQVTRDAHDAEDATQATFLTLAVHAKTAGKIRYVGPWLRKVSHRLALDIRRSKKRRKAREERHANGNGHNNGFGPITEVPVSNGMQMEELRHILREELDKLPSKYRMPLILYYFGGLSPEEMGKELKVNTSTLGVRLHRGRKMLAESLSGRGVTISSMAVGAMLAGLIDTFVRDNLVQSASHAAVQIAAMGGIPDGTAASAPVLAMIRSATSAIRLSRLKGIIAAAVLVATTLTGAAQVLNHYDLLDPSILQKLDVLRFVRPLLDRLLSPPQLSAQADKQTDSALAHSPQQIRGGSTPLLGSDYHPSLTPPLSGADNLSLLDPNMTSGPTRSAFASVASERRLAGLQPAAPTATAAVPVRFIAPAPAVSSSFQINTAPAAPQPIASAPDVVASAPQVPAPVLPSNIASPIVIDRASPAGGNGVGMLDSGQIDSSRMVVGETTSGSFAQTGGKVRVSDTLTLGQQPGSVGTYSISAKAELLASNLTVGQAGTGVVRQTSGHVVVTNDQHNGKLTIADQPGSSGTYLLDGSGQLYADNITVGNQGDGLLQQNNGTITVTYANLGSGSTGTGMWTVVNGQVQLGDLPSAAAIDQYYGSLTSAQSPMPPPTPVIEVGKQGSGTLELRADGSSPTINELPGISGSALVIRSDAQGKGVLHGWGKVRLTGPVVENGRVIADGFGTKHALDLSAADIVTNTIDNSAGGRNGWYARDGGSLRLPPIDISGSRFYTWGEDSHDDVIDLVNSVRFRPLGPAVDSGNGSISISLLDPNSSDIAALPDGRQALSLWSLDSSIDLSGVDLQVRYDDIAAANAGIAESDLGLWVFESGQWQPIGDAGIDLNNHVLWGTASGTPDYFATSTALDGARPKIGVIPEPSTIMLLSLGVGALSLRRRSRRR